MFITQPGCLRVHHAEGTERLQEPEDQGSCCETEYPRIVNNIMTQARPEQQTTPTDTAVWAGKGSQT